MKKILAILLSMLIVSSSAACGGKEPAPSTEVPTQPTTLPEETQPTETEPTEPPNPKFDAAACEAFFGYWALEVKLDQNLMVIPDFEYSTSFLVGWELREDGTYTASPDDTYELHVLDYELQVVEYLVNSRHAMFVAEKKLDGMKEAAIEEAWAEEEPKVREASEATVEELDFCGSYANLYREGHYYVEDGSIYFSRPDGGYDSFEYLLSPTTLTFNRSNNISYYEDAGFQFPLTLYLQTPEEPEAPAETEAEE